MDGFIVFATWLGSAELAVMLGVGSIGFFTGKMETLPEAMDLLWEASIAGAVVGCLPAVAAVVLVKRSRVWILAGLSLLVTMATVVATLYFMLGRG